jgi:hypothetical protein
MSTHNKKVPNQEHTSKDPKANTNIPNRAGIMLPDHKWDMRNSSKDIMVKDKEVMDRREDIIMGGMRRDMVLRDSIWMIDGVGVVGLRRRCWLV